MPRLFVALRPPESVRDVLFDTMEGLDPARWQDDGQLHLTLRFVGEVDRQIAEDLANELARIDAAAVPVTVRGVGHFEKKGRAHTLWAGIAAGPELEALRAKIERACLLAGLLPEPRKFVPHITLARLSARAEAIAPWLLAQAKLDAGSFVARDFVLYESITGHSGSHYEPVARWPLRGG